MIWLSVNLDCFIAELSSSMVENSTSDPVYLQGVLPNQMRKITIVFCLVRYKQGNKALGESTEFDYWVKPLEELGHSIFIFEIDRFLQGPQLSNSIDDGSLYDFSKSVNADWVFLNDYTNLGISAETWKKIADSGIYTSCWFGDDNHKYDDYTKYKAHNFTHPITCDHFSLGRYRYDNLPKPILSQWGADNYPRHLSAQDYDYDISFVGVYSPYRHFILNQLNKLGYKVAFFGEGWPNGSLTQNEMFDVFHRSKINLSLEKLSTNYDLRYLLMFPKKLGSFFKDLIFKRPIIQKQIKKRPFDIAIAKGFQLVEYVPFIEEYFDLKTELKVFTTIDELIFFVNHFLNNEEHRLNYIESAFKKTIQQHTMRSRLENVIKKIF
jgi:hypothetical protein